MLDYLFAVARQRQAMLGSLAVAKGARQAESRRDLHTIYKKHIVLVAHPEEPCLDYSEDSESQSLRRQ